MKRRSQQQHPILDSCRHHGVSSWRRLLRRSKARRSQCHQCARSHIECVVIRHPGGRPGRTRACGTGIDVDLCRPIARRCRDAAKVNLHADGTVAAADVCIARSRRLASRIRPRR